jgi:hypothetical protein
VVSLWQACVFVCVCVRARGKMSLEGGKGEGRDKGEGGREGARARFQSVSLNQRAYGKVDLCVT